MHILKWSELSVAGRGTFSFLTRAFATDVFPEAEGPAMPITWRVNQGGLYSGLSFIGEVYLWKHQKG